MERACREGNTRLESGVTKYSKNSDKNEEFIVSLLKEFAPEFGIPREAVQHLRGHKFPDVLIEGTPFGIELKGTSKSTRFAGNSVFASTMQPGLTKVYVLFWIDQRRPRLGFRDYFECVFKSEVTHSPRWNLDIEISADDSLFGVGDGKLGFTAEDYLKRHSGQDMLIMRELRERARQRGEILWWAPPPDEELAENGGNDRGVVGIRRLNSLDLKELHTFHKTLFLRFPEVLAGGEDSHGPAIVWALSRNILIGRDTFSSGGRQVVELGLPCGPILLPAVVTKCAKALARESRVALADLESISGDPADSAEMALENFKLKIQEQRLLMHLHSSNGLSEEQRSMISAQELSDALVRYLTSLVDLRTIS